MMRINFIRDGKLDREAIRKQLDPYSREKWDGYCNAFTDEEMGFFEEFFERPFFDVIALDLAGSLQALKTFGINIYDIVSVHTRKSWMDEVTERLKNLSEEEIQMLKDFTENQKKKTEGTT